MKSAGVLKRPMPPRSCLSGYCRIMGAGVRGGSGVLVVLLFVFETGAR